MKVKICGITNIDDALLCSDLGADALGFVFYGKSKRNISVDNAGEIISQLPSFITKVGVFVDHNPEEILFIANNIGLNTIQIYSDIINIIHEEYPASIIKALRIKTGFDFSTLKKTEGISYLLDTYSKNLPGGTGETFDWDLIPDNIKPEIILAGGISAKNIKHVFENIKPQAVDLSSSVESAPGRKDKVKLTEFFNIVNRLRYKC